MTSVQAPRVIGPASEAPQTSDQTSHFAPAVSAPTISAELPLLS